MNPGRLDRRLCLLQRTVNTDGAGSPVETWTEVDNRVWAEKTALAGAEALTAGSTRSTVSTVYRIRYRADLAAADASGKFRIRAEGRDHNIVAALEDMGRGMPRRAYMLLSLSYVQGEPTLTSVPAA